MKASQSINLGNEGMERKAKKNQLKRNASHDDLKLAKRP